MSVLIAHPWVCAGSAIVGGFGIAAFLLRFEFRAQLRARRYGGYVAGGER